VSRRRWQRALLVAAGILLLLVVVVRLIADPLATGLFRRQLARLDDFQGRVATVHLGFFPPTLTVHNLALDERGNPHGRREPTLFVEQARSVLSWRQLLRGHVLAEQWLTHPKLALYAPLTREAVEEAARKVRRRAPDVLRAIRRLPPTRVNRLHVDDAELVVVDVSEARAPRLWIHHLRGELRDLVTHPSTRTPTTASFQGRIQRSGTLAFRLAMDPAPERLTFQVHAGVEGLALPELYQLLEAKTDTHADKGTLASWVDLDCQQGRLSGTVRTVMRDVDVQTEHHSLIDRLKAWMADKSFDLVAENNPSGGQTARAVLPIRGTLRSPQAPVVPTVLALVRGAFARGINNALGSGSARRARAD
jgi:hypothetical protein